MEAVEAGVERGEVAEVGAYLVVTPTSTCASDFRDVFVTESGARGPGYALPLPCADRIRAVHFIPTHCMVIEPSGRLTHLRPCDHLLACLLCHTQFTC